MHLWRLGPATGKEKGVRLARSVGQDAWDSSRRIVLALNCPLVCFIFLCRSPLVPGWDAASRPWRDGRELPTANARECPDAKMARVRMETRWKRRGRRRSEEGWVTAQRKVRGQRA